ncbi:MAG: phosphoribosyltransferase [Rickettsiales bacterium]|nr:phosphoribosyltransferase [Rickettsiales bacterium]
MHQPFKNREEAGKRLAIALSGFDRKENTLVLALPRGGVPVAYVVACTLHLPLDVLLVRKLGVPGHEELAMGAIAGDTVRILNEDIIDQLHIPPIKIEQITAKEQAELLRRNRIYRGNRPFPAIKDCTVIVVDDGLATGATMKAAVETLRKAAAKHIIIAVPVGASSTCRELEDIADEVVCLHTPEPFYGVGQWYTDFSQTSDQEVQEYLAHAVPQNDTQHLSELSE